MAEDTSTLVLRLSIAEGDDASQEGGDESGRTHVGSRSVMGRVGVDGGC
jgi:hypothetical protein